jgi:hypothetical protein
VPLRRYLTGHTIVTAFEMEWAELSNGDLLLAAEAQLQFVLVGDYQVFHLPREKRLLPAWKVQRYNRLYKTSPLYHRLLIWLCRNMNTNRFQKLTGGFQRESSAGR